MLGIAHVSGETAPLIFTALGNERYFIGQIKRAIRFQTLYNIVGANGFAPFDVMEICTATGR